jgi:ATP-dependent RNA helicase DeaD
VVVETLAEQFDVMDIAAAAVKLAHESGGRSMDDDEEDIPELAPPPDGRPDRPGKPKRGPSRDMTRLFVGAGRVAGIRPQDLVGAIVNESGVDGRNIGAIEIADRFSLVEVPAAEADHVIQSLRASTIKGRRTNVRRERYPSRT